MCIFINAGINPIIYGFMNENFRNGLANIGITRWVFVYFKKKPVIVAHEKKEPQKETKETSLEPSNKSNNSKVFIIYTEIKQPRTKRQEIP